MLLDTSGLFAYLDSTDPYHASARTFVHAADASVTHGFVLAELFALATSRRVFRPTVFALIAYLDRSPLIEVVWVDEAASKNAMAFLRQHDDKTYSLCDAVSFLLMEQRGLTEALTTDHHFEQAGFRRLLTA